MTNEQPPLFSTNDDPELDRQAQPEREETIGSDEAARLGLNSHSPLAEAGQAFYGHMVRQGFSDNTIKAFQADLRLFTKHVGGSRAIRKIASGDLEAFMVWLQTERGVPCSPKSYARRLTTLKVFFAWLTSAGALGKDPAAPLIHQHPSTPLPEILYEDQINALLSVTRDQLWAAKPDSRPFLLISLILQTGIKKGECMEIKLEHIDHSNAQAPVLYVRYADPRKTLKERKLSLGPLFTPVYGQYRREYQPKEYLFECTARNLEYVLEEAATLAGIKGGVSFEQLRWTCAVRDYRNGTPAEQLRQKLGLSGITWRETLPKIRKLAGPGL